VKERGSGRAQYQIKKPLYHRPSLLYMVWRISSLQLMKPTHCFRSRCRLPIDLSKAVIVDGRTFCCQNCAEKHKYDLKVVYLHSAVHRLVSWQLEKVYD